MTAFVIFMLGVVSGATGYLTATFWVRPILRYLDLKDNIYSDLVFYANAVMVDDDAVVVPEMRKPRVEANRRSAAALAAVAMRLPRFYQWWLRHRREDPVAASCDLIGLSNAADRRSFDHRLRDLCMHLRLPSALRD